MRRFLATISAAVLMTGCTDEISGPRDATVSGRVLDESPSACSHDAVCLDPIIVIGDPGGGSVGGGAGGGDGGGEDGGGECMTWYGGGEAAVQGCPLPGGDGEEEPGEGECEECNPPGEESTICPQPFIGNVQPALITVAGRNHEFRFHSSETYPFTRLTGGRSPATYQIGLPTTSKDAWWIAESGTITVWCRGAWVSRVLWLGTLTVVDSDLHMVMGPGHPDF